MNFDRKYDESINYDTSDEEYSDSDIEIQNNNDDYVFRCKNIDPSLAKLMNMIIEETPIKNNWIPPKSSGLNNSEPIIRIEKKHLEKNEKNIYFEDIKNDIKYFKKLDDNQLKYIKNLDDDQKFEIIQIYQKCLQYVTK
jgi:hypothetical protein